MNRFPKSKYSNTSYNSSVSELCSQYKKCMYLSDNNVESYDGSDTSEIVENIPNFQTSSTTNISAYESTSDLNISSDINVRNIPNKCKPKNQLFARRVKPVNVDPQKNYSFNKNEMRNIEKANQILMQKILNTKVKRTNSTMQLQGSQSLITAAAINRKKQQREIDYKNDILQKKLLKISLRPRPNI